MSHAGQASVEILDVKDMIQGDGYMGAPTSFTT
jgi:hypothetical protein